MPSRYSEFHDGELAVQTMLKVPARFGNPTTPGLPASYAMRVMQSPLVAVGTLDDQGRPWASLWGGERGFASPVAQGVLGMSTAVDRTHDPVFRALWAAGEGGSADPDTTDVVQPGNKMMAALSIDLDTRDRVKLAGNMVAGAKTNIGIQMAMQVTESLGNCPKYLNKREITPRVMQPELVSEGLPLSEEAVRLIGKADMFFMATTAEGTMDVNHRGGSPGFVRVVKNDDDGVVLAYPEFSGNNLYQSLGNLKLNSRVGIVIPDYETSDVLYLTGSATILVGEPASSLLARTKLALQIEIHDSRMVKCGLPFRGSLTDYSPYNPPLRLLNAEHDSHIASADTGPQLTATLLAREHLTPTIARFTFQLSATPEKQWFAGQYVTLDFSEELDAGYAHMNDGDPQSLNDDYIRTFTISSAPPDGQVGDGDRLEITARKHGPATGLLWKHNLRVPLELPVLGFGGEETFRMPTAVSTAAASGGKSVFIAAGVGITPLLAQAKGVLNAGSDLEVLWSVRHEDLPLVKDSFKRIEGLSAVTRLFVTGGRAAKDNKTSEDKEDDELQNLSARVELRRINDGDVEQLKHKGSKFFLCTGPAMLGLVNGWLEGEDVVWEDFGY